MENTVRICPIINVAIFRCDGEVVDIISKGDMLPSAWDWVVGRVR